MLGLILPLITTLAVFALYMYLAWMLLQKYKNTGDTGFMWLGVAVILWPFAATLLGSGGHALMQHYMASHPAKAHVKRVHSPIEVDALPAVLASIQQAIQVGLLLVAVHFLAKDRETQAPTPEPENSGQLSEK